MMLNKTVKLLVCVLEIPRPGANKYGALGEENIISTSSFGRVSIIVPVYNVEKYLRRCLESIAAQTYSDLEILIVDDGSTDSSGNICDDFSINDSRTRVMHKKNAGLSDARNVAISAATGVFILCIDSDDYVSPDHIELLVRSLHETGADIATTDFYRVADSASIEFSSSEVRDQPTLMTAESALELLFYQKNLTTSSWGKLYRAFLFDGIRYPVGKINEDLDTTYRLFARADTIITHSLRTYYYTERVGSITGAQFSARRMEALSFAETALSYVHRWRPSLQPAATNRFFMEAVFILSVMPIWDEGQEANKDRIRQVLRETRMTVLFDGSSRVHARLFALASYFGLHSIRSVYALRAVASRIAWRGVVWRRVARRG
jgi:hypothetical protein